MRNFLHELSEIVIQNIASKIIFDKTEFLLFLRLLHSLGKIRLLDVGSCFNPFLKFEEFLTVGIDIVPAVEVCNVC